MFLEEFSLRFLTLDETAAIAFAQIATKSRRMGQQISQADTQIASICYLRQATLATCNISNF